MISQYNELNNKSFSPILQSILHFQFSTVIK